MTDKVQKIRKEVEMVVNRRLNLLNGDYFDLIKETDGFTNEIMDIIDTLREEPVSEELEKVVEEIAEPTILNAYGTKELARRLRNTICGTSVSEDLDIAIGEYCSNPDNFITYIDVAFAYRSEQKDDIPLIIKAIKFGANWQKEQMMAKAVDAHCFGFQGDALFSFKLPADKYLVGSKVKIIVINEEYNYE